jgi:hypothetical protein
MQWKSENILSLAASEVWKKILKKDLRTRIMCERRIQGAEEVDILADFFFQVMKNDVFQNAI